MANDRNIPASQSVLAAADVVAAAVRSNWRPSPSVIPMVTVESTVFTLQSGQLKVQERRKERKAAAASASSSGPVYLWNLRNPERRLSVWRRQYRVLMWKVTRRKFRLKGWCLREEKLQKKLSRGNKNMYTAYRQVFLGIWHIKRSDNVIPNLFWILSLILKH